jgi:hypothetical protein
VPPQACRATVARRPPRAAGSSPRPGHGGSTKAAPASRAGQAAPERRRTMRRSGTGFRSVWPQGGWAPSAQARRRSPFGNAPGRRGPFRRAADAASARRGRPWRSPPSRSRHRSRRSAPARSGRGRPAARSSLQRPPGPAIAPAVRQTGRTVAVAADPPAPQRLTVHARDARRCLTAPSRAAAIAGSRRATRGSSSARREGARAAGCHPPPAPGPAGVLPTGSPPPPTEAGAPGIAPGRGRRKPTSRSQPGPFGRRAARGGGWKRPGARPLPCRVIHPGGSRVRALPGGRFTAGRGHLPGICARTVRILSDDAAGAKPSGAAVRRAEAVHAVARRNSPQARASSSAKDRSRPREEGSLTAVGVVMACHAPPSC